MNADRQTRADHEVVVVPHTHWDREWHLPFQRFRIRLVRMLDTVLDAMDRDERYRFTLDGQLAAVEDYLELRPHRRDDIARFVAEGRLAVGPWLILADEFLCSGETLLRNLEYGIRGAEALGGAMRVGYLPDQFGHCAQMPQLLALAGLRRACVWRGVPAHVDRDVFDWTGVDGTTVRTRYLPGGYGNAAGLFAEERPAARLAAFVEAARGWASGRRLLAMYGADHSAPDPRIADAGMRLATLGEFLAEADADLVDDGVPTVRGELRSHARANLLPGVISARVPLKQAMARAERVLARYAEPLSALWPVTDAVDRLLDLAWRQVIACSGHDSITGCAADETAQQVAARIAEAEQMGRAVVDVVGASLAVRVPRDGLVVVNPSPFERSGLILADLPEDRARLVEASSGRAVPVQRLEHAPTLLDERMLDDVTRLLDRVRGNELLGHAIASWTAEDGVFTVTVSRHAAGRDDAELRRAVLAARPGPWLVRIVAEPVVTVAARVTVPPLGRTVLTALDFAAPDPGAAPAVPDGFGWPPGPEGVLDNGLLRVRVAGDGTLSLRSRDDTEVHGVGRVAHGGDAGDTYNYAPPPHDRVLDAPSAVRVEEIRSGPLTSALEITRTYDWDPDGGPAVVRTTVELRAGEPYARCELELDVRCRDHRIRWHAPLPRVARESFAEGQLAVVRRGLTAEDGGGERPVPTFPAESFVAAGGLAVLLDHVTEYEVTGNELALTLVRSVGWLSRNDNPYRHEPAGPQLATPAAQCQGRLTTRFAVLPFAASWHEAGLPRLAEEYRLDLLAVPGAGRPAEEAAGEEAMSHGPAVTGDGVMMAALRERGGWLELRLVAEHPVATEAIVHGGFTAARRVDALGSPAAPLEVSDGSVRLPLRPFEIATVQLRRG